MLLGHPIDGQQPTLLDVLRCGLTTDAELDRYVLDTANFLESSHQPIDLVFAQLQRSADEVGLFLLVNTGSVRGE